MASLLKAFLSVNSIITGSTLNLRSFPNHSWQPYQVKMNKYLYKLSETQATHSLMFLQQRRKQPKSRWYSAVATKLTGCFQFPPCQLTSPSSMKLILIFSLATTDVKTLNITSFTCYLFQLLGMISAGIAISFIAQILDLTKHLTMLPALESVCFKTSASFESAARPFLVSSLSTCVGCSRLFSWWKKKAGVPFNHQICCANDHGTCNDNSHIELCKVQKENIHKRKG